jgi:hypothetical protein
MNRLLIILVLVLLLIVAPAAAAQPFAPQTPVNADAPTALINISADGWEVIQYLVSAVIFCFIAWLLHRSIPPEQRDILYARAEDELAKAEAKAKLTPSFFDDLAVELAKRGLVIVRASTLTEAEVKEEEPPVVDAFITAAG